MIAWDALSRIRDQQEFSKGDPTVGRHRAPRANRTALAPAREAFWYFFGACLWTTSRPLSNGARASTRTYSIKAHQKCHRSHPPRVAWHVAPLLSSEKDARGSYKKPGELLIALSPRTEARGLFLQTLPRSTPRGSEKHDEKGHRARYSPEVRRLGHL